MRSSTVETRVERRRGRERIVLAAGLGSAAALVLVALFAFRQDSAASELVAARLAGEVADNVREEWVRLLAAGAEPAPARGERFHWDARAPAVKQATARVDVLAGEDPADPSALELLLREADREEIAGKPADALELLTGALERIPTAPLRPEAFLRAIQLARRAGKGPLARELWRSARGEIGPELARGETAYLLLCTFAASPELEEGERAEMQRWLAERWLDGSLALPIEATVLAMQPDGARVEEPPALLALRERLEALAEDARARELLAEDRRVRAEQALAGVLGELPQPADNAWVVLSSPLGPFCAHAVSGGDEEGFFVDRDALARALEQRLALPADFALDFEGTNEALGELVRPTTALAGPDFGFVVRHADPARLVRGERMRLLALRAGLLVLAALGMLATMFTVRALVRERRLAELKSAFIAGVSHDLRTPLASILLMAENLEAGHVSEERARERYYGSIRREAQRLRRLVENVLDFSRLERGERLSVAREPVDLATFARELATESAERVEAAGGKLTCAAEEVHGEAHIDAFALRRAVWNLVDNALAHSGSKEISLGIAVEGETLVLRVGDQGRGVPPAERERIFEPYTRGTHTNGSSGGAGLGLAIVREIARAHGGEASVRSDANGHGAVFELRIAGTVPGTFPPPR
jgi:signal transduction histidine kinase